MRLNVDGYVSSDGWLSIRDEVLLGADRNDAVSGSIGGAGGTAGAVVSMTPSALNRECTKHAFEEVALRATDAPGGFALHGRREDLAIELRCRWLSD